MNQDPSFFTLTAAAGMNAATALKSNPSPGNGLFYTQASGNENQFLLLSCEMTGEPVSLLPAVTFTSDKFYLDLTLRETSLYRLHLDRPESFNNL